MKNVLLNVLLTVLLLSGAAAASAAEQCDIATMPAATLLLPYFEVGLNDPFATATKTYVTLTNVSREPQIARMTLWTDLDYPIYSFPLFLTGYDQVTISLYDVITLGLVEPRLRTHTRTTPGHRSLPNLANPHFLPSAAASCSDTELRTEIPFALLFDVQRALTTGTGSCGARIGRNHPDRALGYVTVDVVATCTTRPPTDPVYWDEILHDNVLTGEWSLVHSNPLFRQSADGGPMVHIRAMSEGSLPSTFYDRFLPPGRRGADRRQPLPSTFAARFVEGGPYDSDLLIWREGTAVADGSCESLADNEMPIAQAVRFDERENPSATVAGDPLLPVTGAIDTAADVFPPRIGEDLGGWFYLDLDRNQRRSQAWVTARLGDAQHFSAAIDATALADGCTPRASLLPGGPPPPDEDSSCDIALRPAATLFLPYFAVDMEAPPEEAQRTIVTVTNVSELPRVARMTLWTDLGYPVFAFDIFLTGYDVQSIDLRELLIHGRLPATASQAFASCGQLPAALPPALLEALQRALVHGRIEECGNDPVGRVHEHLQQAVGYATIDVVSHCSGRLPNDPAYFDELRFDNVLTADVLYVHPAFLANYALGNPLVHVRAVAGALPATFYGRLLPPGREGHDRRQPLPTTFAAAFRSADYLTDFVIWREPATGRDASCRDYRIRNNMRDIMEFVRFDQRENVMTYVYQDVVLNPDTHPDTGVLERMHATGESRFPPLSSGDNAGWMYFNLDDRDLASERPLQGWVMSLHSAGWLFAFASDATILRNGCSAAVPESDENTPIGPGGGS